MMPDLSCYICGSAKPFAPLFPGASLREGRCPDCKAQRRSSDLMRVLLEASGGMNVLAEKDIYELQASGHVHNALRGLPGYLCSEYLPGTPPGERDANGIRCEDATGLTFADNSFDFVISQDVMEHIEDTWQAFNEINRVLKPGGMHIFTIPLHEGRLTRPRANMEPVFHGDPLRPEGALVHWDFGDDLPDLLAQLGIKVVLALHDVFYFPEEICRVDDARDYAVYCDFMEQRDKISFFLYNSNVFVAEKT